MVSDVLKIVPIVLVAATPIFLFLIWSCCGSGSTSVIDFMDLMDGNNSSADDGGTDLEDATTTSSSASLQQQQQQQQQSQPQQSQQPQQHQGEQQQLQLPWSEAERAQARHDIEHHLVTTKVEKHTSSSSSSAGSYTTRSTSTTTTLSSDQHIVAIVDMDETDAEDYSEYEVVVEASSTSNMSCCSICLTQYKQDDWIARSMNAECPHVFHKECILDWLVTRTQQQQQQLLGSATTNTTTTATTTNIAECPICRREFLVYNMSDNTEETANYILDMDAIGNDNENTHQLQPTTHNNNNNSDLETTTTTQLSLSTLPGTPSTMDHHHDQPTSTTDMGADTVPTNENDDANDSPV